MYDLYRVALCPRAIVLERQHGLTDDIKPQTTASKVAVAINKSIRKAIAECEELQAIYNYRPATEEERLIIKDVLITPDIVFKPDTAVGLIAPVPRFMFAKPIVEHGHLYRMLEVLNVAYGMPARALLICRDSLAVRIDEVTESDEATVMAFLAQVNSSSVPPPPFKTGVAYDAARGVYVDLLPKWPCESCKVNGLCKQYLEEERSKDNENASNRTDLRWAFQGD